MNAIRRLVQWFADGAELRPHPYTPTTGKPYTTKPTGQACEATA